MVIKEANRALQLILSKPPEHQGLAIQLGALDAIVRLLDHKTKRGPSATLFLLLCGTRAAPTPITVDRASVTRVLSIFPKMLKSSDCAVVKDALRVLDTVTSSSGLQPVLEVNGLLGLVLGLLSDERYSYLALRSIMNIDFAIKTHTRALIDAGGIRSLSQVLSSPPLPSSSSPIMSSTTGLPKSDVCWILSDLARAGYRHAVIGGGAVEKVIELLKNCSPGYEEADVKREALSVLVNIAHGTLDDAKNLVKRGALEVFCDILDDRSDFPSEVLEVVFPFRGFY